jgi:hypothetical protein
MRAPVPSTASSPRPWIARGTGILNNEFYIGRLVWTARALFTGGVFFAFISLTGTQAVPSQRNSWCS